MISMRIVLLTATMVVSGLGVKGMPAEQTEIFDAATERCSIPQERSKRTATSSTYNETARSKRQIPCCYGHPYPIITLPSCSIPYTIINGTCYLATCPKPCSTGCVGHTTCCTERNPVASPAQREDKPVPTSHQPTAQQQQAPLNHIDNDKQTESGINSPENSRAPDGANNTINTMEPPVPLKPLPNFGFNTTEELTDPPKLDKGGPGSASTPTIEEQTKTTTSIANGNLNSTSPSIVPTVVNSTSPSMAPAVVNSTAPSMAPTVVNSTSLSMVPTVVNSTSPSMAPIVEKEPDKLESYISCVNNNTACNVSESNKSECEICQCYCTPVNCDYCIDVQPGNDTSGLTSCNLAKFNPDIGCLGCNNYSPVSGCRCSFSNDMSTRSMVETAGLMKRSGNGEGGNTIVSSMNILAGPSCADPCCNQNACMLSHSGNGDGGNRIIANANYVNGGNMLCCSGNGKGGNCMRSMINIIGGNSACVLSACDGKLLKHLCDFMAVDDCSLSGCTPNITCNKPISEPTSKIVDKSVNNTHILPQIDAPVNGDSQKLLPTEGAPFVSDDTENGLRNSSSRSFHSRTETNIQPINSAFRSVLVRPSPPQKLTCDRHLLLNHHNCRRRCLSPNYILVPNNYGYC